VDPRSFAVGEIAETFDQYPEIGPLLPAMGYGAEQIHDLEATLAAAADHGLDALAIGTPIDLASIVRLPLPHTRIRYDLEVVGEPTLEEVLSPLLPPITPRASG
jgi:predicted GTPase